MRPVPPSFSNLAAAVGVVAALLAAGPAAAGPVAGTFNASGYDVVTFAVDAPGRVDLRYSGGYSDPGFALFDATGAHLISNDDANGSLWSHLTPDLGSGTYQLLVTYCCNWVSPVSSAGATFVDSDGTNHGSYWVGGSATLAGVTSFLDVGAGDGRGYYHGAGGSPYSLSVDAVRLVTRLDAAQVPEPATLALVGVALAGLAASRRRA